MEKPKIINHLNLLCKLTLESDASILFLFGDVPRWDKKEIITDTNPPKNYYDAVKIHFDKDVTNLYWRMHRYTGEEMFLYLENNKLAIFEGEINDDQESWNYFDDLEDELPIKHYEVYTVEKTAADWKNDYENLRNKYHSLFQKKSFAVKDFRVKIKEELQEKIAYRLEWAKRSSRPIDQNTLELINQALKDMDNSQKIDLFTTFLFEEK